MLSMNAEDKLLFALTTEQNFCRNWSHRDMTFDFKKKYIFIIQANNGAQLSMNFK